MLVRNPVSDLFSFFLCSTFTSSPPNLSLRYLHTQNTQLPLSFATVLTTSSIYPMRVYIYIVMSMATGLLTHWSSPQVFRSRVEFRIPSRITGVDDSTYLSWNSRGFGTVVILGTNCGSMWDPRGSMCPGGGSLPLQIHRTPHKSSHSLAMLMQGGRRRGSGQRSNVF